MGYWGFNGISQEAYFCFGDASALVEERGDIFGGVIEESGGNQTLDSFLRINVELLSALRN